MLNHLSFLLCMQLAYLGTLNRIQVGCGNHMPSASAYPAIQIIFHQITGPELYGRDHHTAAAGRSDLTAAFPPPPGVPGIGWTHIHSRLRTQAPGPGHAMET